MPSETSKVRRWSPFSMATSKDGPLSSLISITSTTRQPGRYWVWRVAPPLTITRAEIDRSLEIIEASIRAVVGS